MINRFWFWEMSGLQFRRCYLRQGMSVRLHFREWGSNAGVGSRQGGLADAVMQAVEAAPEEVRSLLLANIVLVGGNCKIPGFHERLFLRRCFRTDEIVKEKFVRWPLQIILSGSLLLMSISSVNCG